MFPLRKWLILPLSLLTSQHQLLSFTWIRQHSHKIEKLIGKWPDQMSYVCISFKQTIEFVYEGDGTRQDVVKAGCSSVMGLGVFCCSL